MNFLSNRKQRVMINGCRCEWHNNKTSEIPQGTVLGSILFLNFINGLPKAIILCINLLADDGKIYSNANTEKKVIIQENVTKAENWNLALKIFLNI